MTYKTPKPEWLEQYRSAVTKPAAPSKYQIQPYKQYVPPGMEEMAYRAGGSRASLQQRPERPVNTYLQGMLSEWYKRKSNISRPVPNNQSERLYRIGGSANAPNSELMRRIYDLRSQAATVNKPETSIESREGTIPSGWGGLSNLDKKKLYSDDVPRLYDYSQQQSKYGNFEDYQKAVEARQHGFVPNDYDDLFTDDGGEGETDGDSEAGGTGGGYPYYPGYSNAKEGYTPGAKPNWQLWATVIQETTWNI